MSRSGFGPHRPLYVTVVYRGKCSHCMRIGVAVPLSGTVARLREAVSVETKIPTDQVPHLPAPLLTALCQTRSGGHTEPTASPPRKKKIKTQREKNAKKPLHASLNCVHILKRKSRDFTPGPSFSFFVKCEHVTPLKSFLWCSYGKRILVAITGQRGLEDRPPSPHGREDDRLAHTPREAQVRLFCVRSWVGPCLQKRMESRIPPLFGGQIFYT